jgi:hypothetical protein
MDWFLYIIIMLLFIGGSVYFIETTTTTCADGSKLSFPYNNGDLSKVQSNVTENGSAVSCTGGIYPPKRCSLYYLPICLMRSEWSGEQ